MNTRLDRVADKNIAESMAYDRTTLNGIRQAQGFGSSDVRTWRLFNQKSNIDITIYKVLTTVPQCVEVTLTPRTLASNPVIAFDFAVAFSSASGGGTVTSRYDPLPPISRVQKFRLYVIANGSSFADLSIAFTFWSISDGTYSAQTVTP